MTPPEWAFKALIKAPTFGWVPTERVYFTEEEVLADYHPNHWQVKWPVEEYEGGMVYVPTEEELKE